MLEAASLVTFPRILIVFPTILVAFPKIFATFPKDIIILVKIPIGFAFRMTLVAFRKIPIAFLMILLAFRTIPTAFLIVIPPEAFSKTVIASTIGLLCLLLMRFAG